MLGRVAAARVVVCRAATTASSSVDAREVKHFAQHENDWHDEKGPLKALHSMNEMRVPWIVDGVMGSKDIGKGRVVEVGCGGGVLSLALARRGLTVRGIDACHESILAAESLKQWDTIPDAVKKRLQFECVTVEELAERESGAFDAVVASEVAEHVASLPSFISAAAKLAKKGAPLFFTTINRTTASRVAAVWLAEEVLHVVPSGTHDWSKFVTPEELRAALTDAGCATTQTLGLSYNPACNSWGWTSSTAINYALRTVKL